MSTLPITRGPTRGPSRFTRSWSATIGAALALGLALVATSAAAAAGSRFGDGASNGVIESCVSRDAIRIEADEPAAVLNDGDRDRVVADMRRQFPMLERDGFSPSQVMLWLPRDGRSLYVALMQNPQRPVETCFMALVDARRIAITPVLRQTNFLVSPMQ